MASSYMTINHWSPSYTQNVPSNGTATHFDYNAAYSTIMSELDTALKSTKSQKLRDLISDCIRRLQQLQEFSDSIVKQCFQMQERINQQTTALQQAQAQAEQARMFSMPFQAYPVSTEEVTYFEDPTSSSPIHHHQITTQEDRIVRPHQPQQHHQHVDATAHSQRVAPVVQKQTPVAGGPSKRQTNASKRSTSDTKKESGAPRASKKEKENRDDAEYLNPAFENIPIDKEKMVRESRQRALTHDFQASGQRYSRQALLDMVESGARESVRNFLAHGMLLHNTEDGSKKTAYICQEPGCGARFNNHLGALQHCLRYHLNEFRPCACDKCDKKFYLKIDLRFHQSHHTGIYRLQCTYEDCKFRCNKKADLKVHLDSHSKAKLCVCDICGKSIANPRKLALHKKFHAPGEFHCSWEGCNAVLATKHTLSEHIRRHRALATHRYKCQFCPYISGRNVHLKQHLRWKHDYPTPLTPEERAKKYQSDHRPVTCEKCGKTMKKHSFKYHVKICGNDDPDAAYKRTPVPKRPMTCPYCLKTVSKYGFSHHMKKYHRDQSSTVAPTIRDMVTCSICSSSINSKSFKAHFVKNHPEHEYYPSRAIRQKTEGGGGPPRRARRSQPSEISDSDAASASSSDEAYSDSDSEYESGSIISLKEESPSEGSEDEEDQEGSDPEAPGFIESEDDVNDLDDLNDDEELEEDGQKLLQTLKAKRRRISVFRTDPKYARSAAVPKLTSNDE